ncbi:MAG: metallophosphoesterase family protein [Paludibacter sp.]|nr:metallophosphoesterase family protein [Paludibacter sp.]
MKKISVFSLILFICITQTYGQKNRPKTDSHPTPAFQTVVPAHTFDVILGRPTNHSITLSVLFYKSANIKVEYWTDSKIISSSEKYSLAANQPKEIILKGLKADTQYHYRIVSENPKIQISKSDVLPFHTARAENSDFSFSIIADSHLDENVDTEIYKQTLLNAASDSTDAHFDLGDTFMTDKYRDNYKDALNQYIVQRYYLGLLCNSSPLFFVQGNHDGESGQKLNGKEDNMTVWANQTRQKYFPNPEPNEFYTGSKTEIPFIGLPRNYYAFEWGNAQFIVLDPFLYTLREGSNDPWARTLGKEQYDWLKSTLEKCKAAFKFVFIHNLVGGLDIKGRGRGGAEAAPFFEWGGKNTDGTDGFKEHRPDWEMPIHDLLRKYKVDVVFHGHDHIFAKQDLDGIVYQCISQPGAKEKGNNNQAEEYKYLSGKIFVSPGYMRVKITADIATFEFVKTDIQAKSVNKSSYFSYQLKK